jgi:hypothetical protein
VDRTVDEMIPAGEAATKPGTDDDPRDLDRRIEAIARRVALDVLAERPSR